MHTSHTGDAPQVESTFEQTWGVVLALNLVASVFNGYITMQACTYFHKFFHRDHNILKYTVACIWLGCMTLAVCEFWITHSAIITGYHLPPEQVVLSLEFPILLVVAVTTIFSIQGIYIIRMYRFSHNGYLLVCCCALAGVELGTGFAWSMQVAHAAPEWQEAMQVSKWIITTSFVASVVLDTFIAASMCYQLWRSRMMGLKRTRHLVDKLMRWTIQTGALSSVVSIAVVLMVNLNKNTNFYLLLGTGFLSPNSYAMGLLALLNARTSLDKLDTDHLCLPTATTSLAWTRTSKSTGIPVVCSATIGSTRGGMVHDLGPRRAIVELSRGDPPSS